MSRGPDLARQELWRRRLREFERGTSTVAEFCRWEGVSDAAFYQWRRKLASTSSEPNTVRAVEQVPALSFLPVEIMGGARSVIEVLLPNGARVASSGQSKRSATIAAVVRVTCYRTMFRRSSGPLLGVKTSKPKRGRWSANKGTREARSRRVITQPVQQFVVPGFTDEANEWRSRRSSPRLGKPVTWRRAAGGVVLDRGRVRFNREGSR